MSKRITCIFSINPGRSGSNYLKTIFDHAADCQAFHEPEPVGNGEAMRRFAKGHVEPMRGIARHKVSRVKEAQRKNLIYVETNHCFIKGFGWFLPDALSQEDMGVIILRRDAEKIVQSTLRIGCSPLVPFGRRWITLPDKREPWVQPPSRLVSVRMTYAAARLLKFLFRGISLVCLKLSYAQVPDPKWLAAYERDCVRWYVQETTAQEERFKKRFPRVRYYEVDVEELNDMQKVQEMLAFYGCHAKPSLHEIIGQPTNVLQGVVLG